VAPACATSFCLSIPLWPFSPSLSRSKPRWVGFCLSCCWLSFGL